MGIEGGEAEPRKPHYNISMSRRTRKAQNFSMEKQKRSEERENELVMRRENQKSLKQLIEGRFSLEQHFREEEEAEKEKEKEQQSTMVVRAPDVDGDERLRSKGSTRVTRNYAQILSHLIKVKQESYIRSWRKSALLSIKLIKHN